MKAAAAAASLYRIDSVSGVATLVGTGGTVAFTSAAGAAIPFPNPATTSYGFNFNPANDRIRVVTTSGLNFRINPTNGAGVDGNAGAATNPPNGTNPDKDIPVTGGLDGVAYTNDVTPTAGVTTEYALEPTAHALHLVSDEVNAVLGPAIPITSAGTPLSSAQSPASTSRSRSQPPSPAARRSALPSRPST